MTGIQQDSAAVAKYCAQVLDAQKLQDIQIVDVISALQIADYFVIATGKNARQLRSASDELLRKLKAAGVARLGVEGSQDARWVLVDLLDVVVHLFLDESRRFYDLDNLWGDCPRIPWEGVARRSPDANRRAAAVRGMQGEG